jgi:endonuclease/exonuclease/phosphatase family metal-dependent hydrolase
LLAALAAEGAPYYVVGTNTLTDLAFPVSAGSVVRFTDRDAIIARADLPASELSVSNVHSSLYGTILSLSGITALRGWISADVTTEGHTVRFVATHLESSGGFYGNPLIDLIQAAQAAELAVTFISSPHPVVIAADFNSNATHTPPEQTASVDIMLNAGYIDAWTDLHRGIPGFTWPMYVEDPLEPHPRGPFERIDFVFSRGISPQFVERTGIKKPQSSDHAGVLATFGF